MAAFSKQPRPLMGEAKGQKPEELRASDLAVRQTASPLPGAPPLQLHDRLLRAIRLAEQERRPIEAAGLNAVLVALQDARYKASQAASVSDLAKELTKEVMAL